MIASLGMYDLGAAAPANDRLWALIRDDLRAQGIAAPDQLTRGDDAYWPAWQSPDLVLSQTCGYPYRVALHDKVTLVGAPDHGLPGLPAGYYRSVFVVRRDDARRHLEDFDGAPFVFNDALSQSGWAAPQVHAARSGLSLPPACQSGSHQQSARAVAEGLADIAALDAVSWAMMQEHDPVAARLVVIAATDPTPGLPFVTARDRDPAPILAALARAIAALHPADRALLRLHGIVTMPAAAYLAVPDPPAPARIAPARASN